MPGYLLQVFIIILFLAIIGSFLKLFCSALLIHGSRSVSSLVTHLCRNCYSKSKPWLLVPWLVEESIEMVGGFIHFTIQAARNNQWLLKLVLFIFIILQNFDLRIFTHHLKYLLFISGALVVY